MSQHPGFETSNKSLVCKHIKFLYGLKQLLRAWCFKLSQALLGMSFQNSKSNCSLFFQHAKTYTLFILVCYDDILSQCLILCILMLWYMT